MPTPRFFASPPGMPQILRGISNRYIVGAFLLVALSSILVGVPGGLFFAACCAVASILCLVLGWGVRHGSPWALGRLPAPIRDLPEVQAYFWGDEQCPGCSAVLETEVNFCSVCGHGHNPPPRPFEEEARFAFTRLWEPQPVEPPRTQAYVKRAPHETTDKLFLAAIALGLVAWIVSFSSLPLHFVGITLAVLAPPVLLLFWIRNQDRHEPEPLGLVLVAFAWGAFVALWAAPLNTFLGFAPLAGFTEEIPKALIVLLIASHRVFRKELNGPVDGLVYGAAAGLGFEALENFQYVLVLGFSWGGDFTTAWALRSATPFSHMMWTGITGSFMGLMMLRRGRLMPRDLLVGVLPAAALHALNNSLGLVASTYVSLFALFIAVTVVSAFFFFKLLAEGLRDEGVWGFGQGQAPVEATAVAR